MLNFFRTTQQWSVYPLLSCFLGTWLLVACQVCVAGTHASEPDATADLPPCHTPIVEEVDESGCCEEPQSCEGMAFEAMPSPLLPTAVDKLYDDVPVFVAKLHGSLHVQQTASTCFSYHDPEGAIVLPLERYCVQLK